MKLSTFLKYSIIAGIMVTYYSCYSNNKQPITTAEEKDIYEATDTIEIVNIDNENYPYYKYEIYPYREYNNIEEVPLSIGDSVVALFIVEEANGTLVDTKVIDLKKQKDEITDQVIVVPKFEGNDGNNYTYQYLFKGLKRHSRSNIDCFQFYNEEEWYQNYKMNISCNKEKYDLRLENISDNRSVLVLSANNKTQKLIEVPIGNNPDGAIYPQLFTDIDGDNRPDLIMYYYVQYEDHVDEHTLLFLSSEREGDSFVKLVATDTFRKERKI